MGLFSKRKSDPPPDQVFENLVVRTASVVEGVTSSDVPEPEAQRLFQEAFDVGVGWTALQKAGLYVEVSEPYSKAFAGLVFGMKEGNGEEIRGAINEIIAVAKMIQSMGQ